MYAVTAATMAFQTAPRVSASPLKNSPMEAATSPATCTADWNAAPMASHMAITAFLKSSFVFHSVTTAATTRAMKAIMG